MRTRTTAAAFAAAALLALTACSSHDQGTAERATKSTATAKDTSKDDAKSSDDAEKKPDTELSVGDGFRYNDGVKVTVTGVSKITKFGEFDEKPAANKTPFRVTWTVSNGTKKPLDLDSWGYNANGATSGGQADIFMVEAGSKMMTGRLAPGGSGTFTSEYALAKSDGMEIVFTMTRMDKSADILAEDPHWTGTIK
jgi:hypothetical protein